MIAKLIPVFLAVLAAFSGATAQMSAPTASNAPNTLRGTFALPANAACYVPMAIYLQDGNEFVLTNGKMVSLGPDAARRGEIQLTWQFEGKHSFHADLINGQDKTNLALVIPLWNHFANGVWRTVGADEHWQYKGMPICGIIASNGPGNAAAPNLHPDPANLAAAASYVIVIGIDSDADPAKLRERITIPPMFKAGIP